MEAEMKQVHIPSRHAAGVILLAGSLAACDALPMVPQRLAAAGAGPASASAGGAPKAFHVSGSAVHFFTTAIIHSQHTTDAGMVQRSTDIVHLTGDLNGYLLFHVTSAFDLGNGSMVNTGTQFFSGTVAGSSPVVLHDDSFRFVVDLSTGQTWGEVHLGRSNDAPEKGAWFVCDLVITGTGMTTPAGDAMVDYAGECVRRGQAL
jgi:hypothetical protein